MGGNNKKMVTKLNPENLFEDARNLQEMAIKELEAGNIRDASEKAWGATVRAVNGLIIAKTGEEPGTTSRTRIAIEKEADKNPEMDSLRLRYLSRETSLHGGCFYDGICEPKETIERRIKETTEFINDAIKLAGT
jgi:uncharacterized protein (UPF0332 family)